ncbi:unnamed protein product [Bemisia tabaci]|nr:unnamed protein product [Bemisia tabaci]
MGRNKKFTVRRVLRNIRRGLLFYCQNCSIHGLKYIAEPDRHWAERLFWIIVCLFSIYSTRNLVISNWRAFQSNAVSFVSDTSYLTWDTDFVTVSVCEAESLDKIDMEGQRLFGETRNTYLDGLISSLAFFDGNCRTCISQCSTGELNCSIIDIETIVKEVRTPCEKLMGNCFWSGTEFECCDEFLPLQTELGTCFTINSIHTNRPKGTKLKMTSNRTKGPGKLTFEVSEAANIFLHGRDDVPFINHPQEAKVSIDWGSVLRISFQVKEIVNDPILDQVSIEQRRCRMEHENNLEVYKFYSFSTCVVNCRAYAQRDLCNCTQHFMPPLRGVATCDIHGLECLTKNSVILLGLKSENYSKEGLECHCMPSCSESEITMVSTSITL